VRILKIFLLAGLAQQQWSGILWMSVGGGTARSCQR